MSQAHQQVAAEQLCSRYWPEVLDRRAATERREVDLDPTVPNRRKTDRRDELVIRPARDLRPLANTFIRQDFKASSNRFAEQPEPVSAFGLLFA